MGDPSNRGMILKWRVGGWWGGGLLPLYGLCLITEELNSMNHNFLKLDNTSKTKFLLNRKISFINTGETSILTLSISKTRY